MTRLEAYRKAKDRISKILLNQMTVTIILIVCITVSLLSSGLSLYWGNYVSGGSSGLTGWSLCVFLWYRKRMLDIVAELQSIVNDQMKANSSLLHVYKASLAVNRQEFFNDVMSTQFALWTATKYVSIMESEGVFLDKSDVTKGPFTINQLFAIYKAEQLCTSN